MRAYIKEIVAEHVKTLFSGLDAETVLSWWIANEGRRPVVVVGAGFSRNAVYKKTNEPVRSADVPLWAEVSKAFADDLRIHDTSGIDPLTLAELHRDGVGERRFVDMLRELLRDDDLAPGEAHEALFNFDLEAIVTTNFLDTLLDRDSRCVPIFDDVDVARRIDKPRQIEVIYFHGHRSSPATWVAARSQYEDLSVTRPMILARVRQLLSQHPVLTVGFGLADPDFHQIYRQISLDMKTRNPLGLALLGPATSGELNSEHESSQRRHWERLGIRIARLPSWKAFGTSLARFFGMTNRITVDELKDKVAFPKKPFSNRVEIARSAFEDPNVEKYVETYRGWENAVWRVCIIAEFERGEIEDMKQKMRRYNEAQFGGPSEDDQVRVSIGGGGPSRAPDQEPEFCEAPCFEGRIRKDWELGWLAYQWVMTRRSSATTFAYWLFYRVAHEYWDQRERGDGDADIDIADLLGAVWRTIDARTDESSGRSHRTEAIRQLKTAHKFLLKYGAEKQAKQVADDIVVLGGQVDPPEKGPPEAAHMKEAFRLMMNGEYGKASAEYEKALQKAVCGQDPLLSWLAASGRHDAYRRAIDTWRRDKDKTDAERERERAQEKEYWRERKKYAEDPTVLKWEQEAERRITELRKKTVEQLKERAREQKFERRGFSFSATPHFAWRVFRDLETRDAPPGLQEKYLMPLLDHGGFGDGETLRLRLRFGIKGTPEWLDEKLDEPTDTIEDAQRRDRELIAAWRESWADSNATNTTIVAAIEAMKPLLEVLGKEDAGLPLELLRKAKGLGHEVENHRGWHAIGHTLAKAWRHCAASLRNKESYDAFRVFADNPGDRLAEDELDRRMGELPWYSWIILGVALPDDLVRWLCEGIGQRQRPLRGSSYGTIEGIGNALLLVVGNLDVAPHGLSPASWDLVANWCIKALDESPSEKHAINWLAPILNLIVMRSKQTGDRGSNDAWQKVEDGAYEKLRSTWHGVPSEQAKRMNVSLAISIVWCLSIIMEKDDSRWNDLAEDAWRTIVNQWNAFREFIENNPFSVSKLGWFLATVIERDFKAHRVEAGEKLLALWPLSSSVRHAVPRILAPEFWPGESWVKVVDHLREALGGARGTFSASWRMAISSLLQQVLLYRKGDLPAGLWFLVEHVTLLVANEEAIVANHAAYTTVFCCELCTDEEPHRVSLLEKTLEAMASDSRISVRHAAAYAGGRLPRTAKSQRIVDCARRIHERVAAEPYLILQTQAELGAAEGAAKAQGVSPTPTP